MFVFFVLIYSFKIYILFSSKMHLKLVKRIQRVQKQMYQLEVKTNKEKEK